MQTKDWYEHRHELCPGMVFRDVHGDVVRLERNVPGDGTKWNVADWSNGWYYYDSTTEPGDLVELLSTNGEMPNAAKRSFVRFHTTAGFDGGNQRKGMKLSELITTLQTTLNEHGDTDEIALCFVIEGRPAHRLDVFGSVSVLHDTAEYPKGIAYLVADCNVQPSRLHTGQLPSFVVTSSGDDGEPSNKNITDND